MKVLQACREIWEVTEEKPVVVMSTMRVMEGREANKQEYMVDDVV